MDFSNIIQVTQSEFEFLDSNYFNSAYFGPTPQRSINKIQKQLLIESNPSKYEYETWMAVPDIVRSKIAKLLDCSSENIFHHNSASDVINIVANGFKFEKNKNRVCAIDKEYPSNILPWMLAEKRNKIKFSLLKYEDQIDREWLENNLPEDTKIFNISHVTFDTGRKINIKAVGEYLREKGIIFILDATQSFGGLEISKDELDYVDVLACSTYKWLLSPYGHSFGYFSNNILEQIEHSNANWITSPNSEVVYKLCNYTVDTLSGARKFDRGQCANLLNMKGLEGSLDLFNEIGLDNIQNYNNYLKTYFLNHIDHDRFDILTPINLTDDIKSQSYGNIISLVVKGINSIEIENKLKTNNIDVSVREGKVRISFHLFNRIEQIDHLIKILNI